MAVFAIHDTPGGLLICNGYKDEEYVELAIMARKLGRRAIIVVEQLYEIETVLQVAGRLGIEPELGLRMNPATKGSGRWEASAGEGARFGLNSYEVMEALRQLKEHGKDHWVSLLHFHVGSQITAINSIKRVLREATRMYTELARLCPSLCFLDIGGGLAVDYDGSRTNFASSMNYTIPEYARDVVWAILSRCREAEVRPPDILSESGRAIVAHHSMLVAEVTDVAPVLDAVPALEPPPSDHPLLKDLVELYETVSLKNCVEVFHDALAAREDTLMRFEQGDLSLEERAYADRTVKRLFSRIDVLSRGLRNMPEDIAKLGASLRDMYFCNFSVFQSLPDLWAVDQLFPIMPIHRLDTEPVRRAVIADLTCDSDGKIENFIDQKAVKPYVRVHELNPVEPYYLAVFLVGAYQEILGDLHNLFGDTNAVHVDVSPDGQVELAEIIEGDTIREVLGYVQFDPHDLLARLRRSIEVALRNGALSPEESAKMLRRFREGLDGYTYFVRES